MSYPSLANKYEYVPQTFIYFLTYLKTVKVLLALYSPLMPNKKILIKCAPVTLTFLVLKILPVVCGVPAVPAASVHD